MKGGKTKRMTEWIKEKGRKKIRKEKKEKKRDVQKVQKTDRKKKSSDKRSK